MSVPSSLLPADARGVDGHLRTRHDDPHRILDRVHDHVLRLLGEEEVAARVLTDVAARASARARDLGEVPTFAALVGLAHARMASTSPTRPDDALVARLAGSRERAGRTLVAAMASAAVGADGRGAALLDLTARHDIELRRAAAWIGIERATAERARTEALRQIHAALADRGPVPDVPATLARLPVVKAPPQVHHVADLSGATAQRRPLPSAVAWLGTAAAVLGTVAAITVGLPTLASADLDGAPVATAEGVIDGPAVRQLATPGDDVPEGGVEPLAVHDSTEQEQAAPPSSETTTDESEPEPEPTPSPEPSPTEDAPEPEEEPTDEPSEEPTEEPSPEPSEGPLDDLLPTDP